MLVITTSGGKMGQRSCLKNVFIFSLFSVSFEWDCACCLGNGHRGVTQGKVRLRSHARCLPLLAASPSTSGLTWQSAPKLYLHETVFKSLHNTRKTITQTTLKSFLLVCFSNFYLLFSFKGTCLWDVSLGLVFKLALFSNFKTASGRERRLRFLELKIAK